jgi:hypothetical protein
MTGNGKHTTYGEIWAWWVYGVYGIVLPTSIGEANDNRWFMALIYLY